MFPKKLVAILAITGVSTGFNRRGAEQTVVSPRAGSQTKFGETMANDAQRIARDPRIHALYLRLKQAELAATYGPFFLREKFADNQRKQLLDVLTKSEAGLRNLQPVAVPVTMLKSPAVERDPAIERARERIRADARAGKLAVLGVEAFKRLGEYDPPTRGRICGSGRAAGRSTRCPPSGSVDVGDARCGFIVSRRRRGEPRGDR